MSRLRSCITWFFRPRVRGAFWVLAIVIATVAGVMARERILRLADRWEGSTPLLDRSQGTLFIVGGGALPASLKREFLELAGGNEARLVVIPGAAVSAERMDDYTEDWQGLGAHSVKILHADSRSLADDPQLSLMLEEATGVWLGGGQQTWFSAWYRGTIVETRLKNLLARGGVIGGTSAGASAMSEVMMAGGRNDPITGKGLNLFPEAVIDQHCLKRNRVARLMKLTDQHPNLIGFGIDEATALIVERSRGRLSVSGNSYVFAYVPETSLGEPRIEILKAGDQTSLADLRNPEAAILPGWVGDSILYGE